tara:strand:+ start:248038 stop:249765 length:1728 start_codon:yes stop_codon:yes gene_type:complete
MAGIYGVFLKVKNVEKFYNYFYAQQLSKNEISVNGGVVGRSVLEKLHKHRFIQQRGDVIICFEGINLTDDIKSKDSFFSAYKEEGISFIKRLKGTFSGFVYDETEGKVFVFNDHLSTKNIFYYYDKEIGFVFSSELRAVSKLFQKEKIQYSVDRDAVYMMALYGFLLEDHTYINEVKKLPFSSLLTYDIKSGSLKIDKLKNYSTAKMAISHSDAIHGINEFMEKSVLRNWTTDIENGSKKHLSLLSGGMDARTNIIVAKKLGFDNITSITFGQSDSKDVKYAQKIAIGENLNHFQRQLDNPDYLIADISKNYILPNDGLMMYHSSAHTSSTVKSFNVSNYATLHTGQIGDLLFGSFTKEGYNFKQKRGSIGYTGFISDDSLLDKIESLPHILAKYQERGMELYTYEQRVINATLVGDRSLNNIIDNNSPFFDSEFVDFCISLPSEYKSNQMIYFEWLKKYHPSALKYPWDKIEMRPNSKFKIIYGKKLKKYVNGGKKYFNLKYESMNPYGQWIKNFPVIMETFDHIAKTEINANYIDNELKEDLLNIYENNIFEYRNKFAVVTALLSLKLHFQEN